jgi:hypothetical protein
MLCSTIFRRGAGLAMLGTLALLLSSCSSGRKPVYPIQGQVLDANNKPAVGALVVLHPSGDDKDPNKPRGYVGEDGTFQLTTYSEKDGAPEGTYVATVEWRLPRKSPYDPEGADRLQGRYSNPKKSGISFTVEKGKDNVLPPIQLR